LYPAIGEVVAVESSSQLSKLVESASSVDSSEVASVTAAHLRSLSVSNDSSNSSTTDSSNAGESSESISVQVPLSTLPSDTPTNSALPNISKIKQAVDKRQLFVIVCGMNVEGGIAGEGAIDGTNEFPIDDEENDSTDEKSKSSLETQILLQQFTSLIMNLDPLLTRADARLSAQHALRLTAAWGVSLSDKTCIAALEAVFGNKFVYQTNTKKKFRLIKTHVGSRNWSSNYFGVGVAVESECVVSVYTKTDEEKKNDDDQELVGDFRCRFVQVSMRGANRVESDCLRFVPRCHCTNVVCPGAPAQHQAYSPARRRRIRFRLCGRRRW